jgi:hypothetical protein
MGQHANFICFYTLELVFGREINNALELKKGAANPTNKIAM